MRHSSPAQNQIDFVNNTTPSDDFRKQIIESLEDYAVFTINNALQITSWNSAAKNLFDYTEAEIIGENIKVLFTDADIKNSVPQQDVKLALNSESVADERYYVRKDGNLFYASSKLFPLKDSAGRIIGFTKMIWDTSSTKAVNQPFAETKEVDNIRLQDEFINVASHELKTPITVIKLYAQILEKLILSDANLPLRKPVYKIQEQAEKISQLLSTLVDLSHLQAKTLKLKFEYFDLSTIIEKTLENFSLIQQAHKLKFTNKVIGRVFADKIRISQVLTNFITDAIKYSPSTDTIYIDMYKDRDGKKFMVTIRDSCVRVRDEDENTLFQRLSVNGHAADYSFKSAGLGLYIASEIVHQHGGEIGLQSEENKCTEFFFTIPAK